MSVLNFLWKWEKYDINVCDILIFVSDVSFFLKYAVMFFLFNFFMLECSFISIKAKLGPRSGCKKVAQNQLMFFWRISILPRNLTLSWMNLTQCSRCDDAYIHLSFPLFWHFYSFYYYYFLSTLKWRWSISKLFEVSTTDVNEKTTKHADISSLLV